MSSLSGDTVDSDEYILRYANEFPDVNKETAPNIRWMGKAISLSDCNPSILKVVLDLRQFIKENSHSQAVQLLSSANERNREFSSDSSGYLFGYLKFKKLDLKMFLNNQKLSLLDNLLMISGCAKDGDCDHTLTKKRETIWRLKGTIKKTVHLLEEIRQMPLVCGDLIVQGGIDAKMSLYRGYLDLIEAINLFYRHQSVDAAAKRILSLKESLSAIQSQLDLHNQTLAQMDVGTLYLP